MQILFFIFALLAVCGALMVIFSKNPVASAVSLVVVLFALAAIYALLGAFFISVVQVLVYAGAIMVLFLFVVMLLNLRGTDMEESPSGTWGLVGMMAAVIVSILLVPVLFGLLGGSGAETKEGPGNTELVGELLFTKYLLPFELTSFLLLAAMVGVIVLVKRERDSRRDRGR